MVTRSAQPARCPTADHSTVTTLPRTRAAWGAAAVTLIGATAAYGMAIANVLTAWEDYGITAFDCSAGGLGGCPSAPGASGNVATEDVVFALKASGASVPVDEGLVVGCAHRLSAWIGHPLRSRLSHILPPGIQQPALKV